MSSLGFHFRGNYHSLESFVEEVYKHSSFSEEQIQIANQVVNIRLLSEILVKGGMPRLAKKLEVIADIAESKIDTYYSTLSEQNQIHKKYCRKMNAVKKADLFIHNLGVSNELTYFIEEVLDIEHFDLNKYVDVRYGTNKTRRFVDPNKFSDMECEQIAKAFKIYMKKGPLAAMENDTKKTR